MTALTRTDLVNLALREIGTDRVDDYTENSPEASVASDVWTQAVRMTLARHEWHFAMQSASLPQSATVPITRHDYVYTLPGDFIRLGSVSQYDTMEPPLLDYVMRADGIHASVAAVFIDYVYDAPAIGTWSPWFISVFTADLASLMASPLKSSTERERLEELALARLRTGRTIDSQQGPVKMHRGGSWIDAHRGARVR